MKREARYILPNLSSVHSNIQFESVAISASLKPKIYVDFRLSPESAEENDPRARLKNSGYGYSTSSSHMGAQFPLIASFMKHAHCKHWIYPGLLA